MKNKIKIGPVGIGKLKDAVDNLENYGDLGFKACEIPFTYGVYIKEEKHKEFINSISKKVKDLGIALSIHAPYWINLNSNKQEVVEKSKERILKSCRVGEKLGAKKVIFHPGYYSGKNKEDSYDNIRDNLLELKEIISRERLKIRLAPETTGKINVFGDEDEIIKLVEDVKCSFCIDFAHLLARSKGKENYRKMIEKFSRFKEFHTHFSGIEFGEKGEKKHLPIDEGEFKRLLEILPKNKNITMICESPEPVEDAAKMIGIKNDL